MYGSYFTFQFFFCSAVMARWHGLHTTSKRETSSTNNLEQKPGKSSYVLRLPTGMIWLTSTFFFGCNLLHTAHRKCTLLARPTYDVWDAAFKARANGFHHLLMFLSALLILPICWLSVSVPPFLVLGTLIVFLPFINNLVWLRDVYSQLRDCKNAYLVYIFLHFKGVKGCGAFHKLF